jgi:dTDP-4-amino-4,6-dideoxygalactose transaminase
VTAAEGKVPFVDLRAQYATVEPEVTAAMQRVMQRQWFILGPELQAFESAFARYCGAAHAVGVASGTDAIELMIRAVGIGTGDEVVTSAHTFVASVLGIERAGAKPVLVDCEPATYGIDPARALAAVGPRTKAVLGVHMYGHPAPLRELRGECDRRGILLLEDAAQAHGATLDGVCVGGLGAAAAFSFYPGKNLGAYGDGGAVTTADAGVAARLEAMRNYGSPKKYHHPSWGTNSRLDELQAAILAVKLQRLDGWNAARARAAERYSAMLADLPVIQPPRVATGATHAWHLYVVRVPRRDHVLEMLRESGIEVAVHYPTPIHLHGAFAHLGLGIGAFPEAERAATEILSLPLFPEITEAQQARVVAALRMAVS